MEDLTRNLFSLKAEYRDKGEALRGYENIISFIRDRRDKELAWLLRNHATASVYGKELQERFEIDALIEFYNILLIAVFAGYAPAGLSDELNTEIKTILSHPSVKPYYQEYYPYKLTEYTLQYITSGKPVQQVPTIDTLSTFSDFLSQNRMLKTDKDLERFMNMLDHVTYAHVKTIKDVIHILSSSDKLEKALTAKEKTQDIRGVWGFFKYTVFISQFRELLGCTDINPLLHSAMWLYHGYYFSRLNTTMKAFFEEAFANIEKALATPELFTSIATELYGGQVPESFNAAELKGYASAAVEQSREDVRFVLDEKWEKPLKNYFEGSQPV